MRPGYGSKVIPVVMSEWPACGGTDPKGGRRYHARFFDGLGWHKIVFISTQTFIQSRTHSAVFGGTGLGASKTVTWTQRVKKHTQYPHTHIHTYTHAYI